MAPPIETFNSSNPYLRLKTLRLALFKAQSEDKKKTTIFNCVDPSFFEECSLEEIEDLTASECYLKISKFYESYADAFDPYDKILLITDKLFIDFTLRTPYSSFFKDVEARLKFFKVDNFDALIIHKFLDLVTPRIRNQTWFKDVQPDDFCLESWSKAALTWDKHANSGLVKAFRNSYISNNTKKDVAKKEVDHAPIAPVGPSIASAQRAIFDTIYDYIMIDSGCKVNVLSKLTFDKLDPHTQSLCKFDDNFTVKLPNSTNATCIGTIVLPFSCPFAKINKVDITFCVFDFQWNLMGLDTCIEFKLLSKLESLLSNECAAIDVDSGKSDVSCIIKFLDNNPILYNDVITNSKITVNLPLPPSVTPFNAPLIRFAKDLKSVSKDILDSDVEKGILRKVPDNESSPWLSNAFTIAQDGKKPRLVINPKHLNSQIAIPSDIVRRLPTARDVFSLISKYYESGKSKDYCFSSFDIQSAYHNCRLSPDQAKFLRFKTEYGIYEPQTLIFGLNVSSHLFICELEKLMSGIDNIIFYSDDGLVVTERKHHPTVVINILSRLLSVGWKISVGKSVWMTDTLEYIGLQISPRGISIPDSKKAKFLNFSRPKSLKQLMFFCNSLNYYRSMIPEFSVLIEHFYSMKSFRWLDAEESRFKRILEILSQHTYLTFIPSNVDYFSVTTLVSERAVSSALYWHKDSNSGLFDLAGRTLSTSESNYLSQTKILLAAKEIIYDNHNFIFDIPIRILINDASLKSVLTKANEPTSAQTAFQRFRLFLECYNVEYIFTKTVDMFNKLRIENHLDEPTPICALQELIKDNALESIEVSDIVCSYTSDFPASLFYKVVASQDISDIELRQLSSSLRQYINTDNIFVDTDGLIKINNKIYIPSSYENELLKLLHKYHRSASAMMSLCKSQFILENYSTKINSYYLNCSICMMYRRSGPRKISTWPSCSQPRQRWHCDHLYFRNKYLLVITDVFSNFLILYHLPSLSVSTLREAFNCIFAQYGKPTILVLDNHPSFAAKEIKQYFLSHSIFIIYAIKYQHHSNGYAENMVGYTKASLTKLMVTENFKSAVNLTMLKNHSSPFHDSTPEKLFFKDNNLTSEIILRHTPDVKIINQRGMFKIKPEEKLWRPCLVEQKLGSDTFLVLDDDSSSHLLKSNCVNLNIGPALKSEILSSEPSNVNDALPPPPSNFPVDENVKKGSMTVPSPNNVDRRDTVESTTAHIIDEDNSMDISNDSVTSQSTLVFQSSTPASEKAILSFKTEHQFNDFLTLHPEYKTSFVFMMDQQNLI